MIILYIVYIYYCTHSLYKTTDIYEPIILDAIVELCEFSKTKNLHLQRRKN